MFDSIFSSTADTAITVDRLLLGIAVAALLGFLISLVYMKTNSESNQSRSFSLTLVFLPVVITVIILMVGSNIARAFSLAGAFSIVRFRSAPGNPKDITYVLFTMAIGLSCGMGFLAYGVIIAVSLCVIMFILELVKFGTPKATHKILKITIPEDLDFQNAFDGILKKYTSAFELTKIKTTNLGSLYELTFSIAAKAGINEKMFIDDLRCRNGNMNITLVLGATNNQFDQF